MILAAAQIKSIEQNTDANLDKHYKLVDLAAQYGVQLIVFPEMSITGYEREPGNELAFSMDHHRHSRLRNLADLHNMVIIAGAPVKIDDKLFIGSFIYMPGKETALYTKQYLHDGEKKFYSPNPNYNPVLDLEDQRISLAICADIANPNHSANASANNSTLYLASLFYTPGGIGEAYDQLNSYARKYSMNVLMSNYTGSSYRFESAGKSAFWNKEGELVAKLDEKTEGLLIVERKNENWLSKVIALS